MSNVLEKIVSQKKTDLLNVKKKYSNNLLSLLIKQNKSYINFKNKIADNIKQNKISVIAEIKKASPSAGLIIKQYNPITIAENYIVNGATCLSILTEEKFFLGDLQHIADVKKKYKIPILCKDFFIDSYQVPLAKSFGADAILIILSGIDNKLAIDIYQTANELNVTSIVEVHTPNEAEKALNFDKAIIGINNRNLKDLKTNIKTTLLSYKILSSHSCPIVSESGFKSEKDVKEIIDKTGIMNFLIGESLLKNIEGTSLLKKIIQINQ